jgi:hypothetical protein
VFGQINSATDAGILVVAREAKVSRSIVNALIKAVEAGFPSALQLANPRGDALQSAGRPFSFAKSG